MIFCSIRIDLSFESKSSSVSQLDVEWQAKLLVLKHMEDPVFQIYSTFEKSFNFIPLAADFSKNKDSQFHFLPIVFFAIFIKSTCNLLSTFLCLQTFSVDLERREFV